MAKHRYASGNQSVSELVGTIDTNVEHVGRSFSPRRTNYYRVGQLSVAQIQGMTANYETGKHRYVRGNQTAAELTGTIENNEQSFLPRQRNYYRVGQLSVAQIKGVAAAYGRLSEEPLEEDRAEAERVDGICTEERALALNLGWVIPPTFLSESSAAGNYFNLHRKSEQPDVDALNEKLAGLGLSDLATAHANRSNTDVNYRGGYGANLIKLIDAIGAFSVPNLVRAEVKTAQYASVEQLYPSDGFQDEDESAA